MFSERTAAAQPSTLRHLIRQYSIMNTETSFLIFYYLCHQCTVLCVNLVTTGNFSYLFFPCKLYKQWKLSKRFHLLFRCNHCGRPAITCLLKSTNFCTRRTVPMFSFRLAEPVAQGFFPPPHTHLFRNMILLVMFFRSSRRFVQD